MMDISILAGKKTNKKSSFHNGALHRALGLPEGSVIPPDRIKTALTDKRPEVRRLAAELSKK